MSSPAETSPQLIAADTVIPMDPALPKIMHNAGVVVQEGKIAAVGELSDLRREFGNLPEEGDRRGVLLPGFVNAHTHLELSYQSAAVLQGGHFTPWATGLIRSYPPAEKIEGIVRDAIRRGAAESVRCGVTTVGDITRHAAITRSELAAIGNSGLPSPRVVSFGEVMGLGKLRGRAAEMIQAAITLPENIPPSDRLVLGISPHAPYTVEGPALRACVRAAIIKSAPIAMHLAENLEEIEFLSDLAGPFGNDWEIMRTMDLIDDQIPLFPGGPVRWAQRWGLLLADAADPRPRRFPVLLAHVNYCDRGEMAQLAVSRASVAYCPRTHHYFKHPPHRYRDMLDNGINVCLGTDSRASNPDLSILREAQLLVQRDNFDPYEALATITRRGAEALGMGHLAGTLTPGKLADLTLFAGPPTDDVLPELLRSAPEPRQVWIGGRAVTKS